MSEESIGDSLTGLWRRSGPTKPTKPAKASRPSKCSKPMKNNKSGKAWLGSQGFRADGKKKKSK